MKINPYTELPSLIFVGLVTAIFCLFLVSVITAVGIWPILKILGCLALIVAVLVFFFLVDEFCEFMMRKGEEWDREHRPNEKE